MEFTIGLTVESIQASGKLTKWKVMAFLNGQMEGFMMENTLMTKKQETAFFTGLMVVSILANG